jgi:two-component system, NtrC family, nitrogen regulation sensor histidine kinase NtrY
MSPRPWQRHVWVGFALTAVALLGAAVFMLGSLKPPFEPGEGNDLVVLFGLSTLIGIAFLVFSLVLTRSLVRLWAERRAGQLGSRFKTKLVLGAIGISLLPVTFLFFFSYALVNRTLNSWFPRPLELANEQSLTLIADMSRDARNRLDQTAEQAAGWLSGSPGERTLQGWAHAQPQASGWDAAWTAAGERVTDQVIRNPAPGIGQELRLARKMPTGAEVWQDHTNLYMTGSAAYKGGIVYAGRRLRSDYLQRYAEIENEARTYQVQRSNLRAYKREILLVLLLITLLLLFATTWVALYLSKQITGPIQALAEGTQEITRGNFTHSVAVPMQTTDELGTLITSFNQMTAQLGEGQRQINDFTRNLQQAVDDRESRRKLMEAILEHIPTGVVSLDPGGAITRTNSAVHNIFGDPAHAAKTLADLLGEEASRVVLQLMRRSLRLGAASREMEVAAAGRLVRAAVTVSSLGPRSANPGFVVVIDDITELLRAQRAAAWQEVAQRIAHEIKNPLTPVQLSAQRLLRHLDKTAGSRGRSERSELESLVAECAGLIEREVHVLESLVDEFSQFARFPSARLGPADLNSIVESALALFQDRLDGIAVAKNLAVGLPPIKADSELLRRVLVNLIDNAAEAMEGATVRRLSVSTRLDRHSEAVEVEVADTGHGISPEDKDKLFLPHFSTKKRGTGLGLAISSRIIAEHNGSLRMDDNSPVGARFRIRFPALEIAAPSTTVATTAGVVPNPSI